ncbi:MAG: hypothetical protein ACRD3C_12985 [Vicinamibacterales bacterium]
MPKYLPHGSTVTFDGSAIGGLITVSIPDRTRGEAEVTDSASTWQREYYPGLREGGSVSLTFRQVKDDVGQLKLESNYLIDGSGAVKSCTITLPTTAGSPTRTYTFNAFVSMAPSGDLNLVDDAVAEMTATLKVAGAVVISN